jgi:predicted dehydrogenase
MVNTTELNPDRRRSHSGVDGDVFANNTECAEGKALNPSPIFRLVHESNPLSMAAISVLIIGAGDRGSTYAAFSDHRPDLMRVAGVAEPRSYYRERMAEAYGIPASRIFRDWREALSSPRFADAVVVATGDREHAGPAIAAVKQGYHLLLEKPMAPDADSCRRIVGAVKASGVLFSVCHPIRYTEPTRLLRSMVNQGVIGDLVSIQHIEPVGYWHQAHSFVRGNWRNEAESGFMLLTKSCHDLDWIRFIMDRPCRKVSSFGSLTHFRAENRPENSAARCLDCAVESDCPYSAKRIYLDAARDGKTDWPVSVLTPEPSPESVERALREGPYGRCVYDCDNDVVDHQVVNLEFDDGATASFTMTAFTDAGHRMSHLFGTRGHLYCDGRTIQHFDFLTNRLRSIPIEVPDYPVMMGHEGGDFRVMDGFVQAVISGDAASILSGADDTLESHLMVFAAEKARRENRVIDLDTRTV